MGWTSGATLAGFAVAAVALAAFVGWELRMPSPMLFGFIFLVTQYFQLVRGYGQFEAGMRTIPVALSIATAAVVAPKVVERIGTKRVVSVGLALMGTGFLWVSVVSATTPYPEIVGQMVFLGVGLGLTTAPATESILGSLPADKAGIGSAVNEPPGRRNRRWRPTPTW
ncbi:MAG: hypothetical protein RIB98_18390 [Acidimicrobiales bacterium]